MVWSGTKYFLVHIQVEVGRGPEQQYWQVPHSSAEGGVVTSHHHQLLVAKPRLRDGAKQLLAAETERFAGNYKAKWPIIRVNRAVRG
jgi:hypothetical protein